LSLTHVMQKILWLSFLLFVACYITGPLVDPDLWWHIMAGRWILSHSAVPHQDYWSMFGQGQTWRAYSWSSEVLYALAERWWGLSGLLGLKFILAAVIVFSFAVTFTRLSGDGFVGALLAAFTSGACVSHFTLRPQSLVWALMAWLIYHAHRMYVEGFSNRRAAWIALLFVIWANTHVTTVLGLAVLGAMAFVPERKAATAKILGIGFGCTLVTPYVGGEWWALLSQASHPFDMRSIAEFRPATIMHYPTAFLVIAVVMYAVLVFWGSRCVVPMRVAGLGTATLAGLAVIKFLPLSSIYAVGLVAIEWRSAAIGRPALNLVEAVYRLRTVVLNKIPAEGLSFLLLALSLMFVMNGLQSPLSTRVIPATAVDFIQQKDLGHPILNDFGRGGYLMYRFGAADGSPGPLVSIDGRTNLIPPKVWEKHQAALLGKENWQEYFDLVKPRTVLWPNESPLVATLIATREWCRVFRTRNDQEGFSVFVTQDEYLARRADLISDNCH